MKVALVPHFEQLRILVNYNGQLTQGSRSSFLPALYAPWPDALEKGFAEINVEGDTLKELLTEVGDIYKQANVDFEPICPITHDLKPDYDVFVNGKNCLLLPEGLGVKLRDGDEVKVLADTIGHC
jgi:hypothetical protein